MPAPIKKIFAQLEEGKAEMFVPAMVFAEIAYLSERNRIETNLEEVDQYIRTHSCIHEHPLTLRTVEVAFSIDDVPELHDRLIAASAKEADAVLITNDPVIEKSSHVETLWR